jgi:hypothetical protein
MHISRITDPFKILRTYGVDHEKEITRRSSKIKDHIDPIGFPALSAAMPGVKQY